MYKCIYPTGCMWGEETDSVNALVRVHVEEVSKGGGWMDPWLNPKHIL